MESKIIEYYKQYYNIEKTNCLNISALLNKGRIKIYKDDDYGKYNEDPPAKFAEPIVDYFTPLEERNGNSLFADTSDEFIPIVKKGHDKKTKRSKVVLKISGVWETANEVGLTYKFMEMTNYNDKPI